MNYGKALINGSGREVFKLTSTEAFRLYATRSSKVNQLSAGSTRLFPWNVRSPGFSELTQVDLSCSHGLRFNTNAADQ